MRTPQTTQYRKQYRKKNIAKRRAYFKQYYEKHKERIRHYSRKHREKNLEKERNLQRKRDGLPDATRPCPMVCELCGKKNKSGHALHLDHDHPTRQFRGWLCIKCNLSIGGLGDSIAGLERAIAYLKGIILVQT